MRRCLLIALVASAAFAESPFRFSDITPESVQLTENGQPVYVYNHGLMKNEGAPADRYRCCYVHPVYAPNGVVLTDDFPEDHYHHRGIFWAWPVVTIGGQSYDPWMIEGIRASFGRWLARETTTNTARLAFENGWFLDGAEVVRERVEIVAHPAERDQRRLEFNLQFEALGKTVGLRGAPADSKGYGGFCVRFAPRRQTVITTDAGREAADTNMAPHAWAREDGLFQGGGAGLRIDIDPENPAYPNGWCLRHYGFLGVNFPGNDTYQLTPGRPLVMKYTVTAFAITKP